MSQVAQSPLAVRQRLAVIVPQPGREGAGKPAPQPDQDGCPAGQETGPGQRRDRLSALVQ